MKVLKFGGTSVGSVKSILSLKKIVETEARTQPVVVVVSALGGITDKLIATSQMALKGDDKWREEFDAMVTRHHQMIDTIITDDKKRVDLFNKVDQLFDQLKSIYYGVYLIHDLSKKTEDAIVSYGERLSSNIVATLIKGGKRMNSRDFIRTEKKNGKPAVINIRRITLSNDYYRREIWTGEYLQVTVMCIPAGGEIGLEVHEDLDQFLRVEYGVGSVYAGSERRAVEYIGEADASSGIFIPAGTYHNVLNRRNVPLKLYSVYAPPKHPVGTTQRTKFDADLEEG